MNVSTGRHQQNDRMTELRISNTQKSPSGQSMRLRDSTPERVKFPNLRYSGAELVIQAIGGHRREFVVIFIMFKMP